MNFSARGYSDLKNYTEALPPKEQEKIADRILEGSLDYNITLEEALKMEVRVFGKLKTLEWVAKNNPARLELLIDTMPPGSVLFKAVMLVYDANLEGVLEDVEKQNRRMRQAGIDGLHIWIKKTNPYGKKKRPCLSSDIGKPRLCLTEEILRGLERRSRPRPRLQLV